jgi:hypothetical protein
MSERIQVGTLLHYSWGWEQTNCDFYQVVERRGLLVTIRAIAGREIAGRGGSSMSCYMSAVRDAFLDGHQAETLVKRIGPWGLSMAHGSATPTDEAETHYCSWYA